MIRSIVLAASFALFAAPAFAFPAITVADAGFASGPGTDYDTYGKLPTGTHVDVIWCGTHKDWCLINVHKTMGWLPETDLVMKSVNGLVPLGGSNGSSKPGALPTGSSDDDGGKSAAMATQPGGPGNTGLSAVQIGGPYAHLIH